MFNSVATLLLPELGYNHATFLRDSIFFWVLKKGDSKKTTVSQISKVESVEPNFLKKICYLFAAIILIETIYRGFRRCQDKAHIYDRQIMKT